MKIKRVTSDGTLKGTKVLNELGLDLQMVREVHVEISSRHPVIEGIIRIHHYIMKEGQETPVFDPEQGEFEVRVIEKQIKSLVIELE